MTTAPNGNPRPDEAGTGADEDTKSHKERAGEYASEGGTASLLAIRNRAHRQARATGKAKVGRCIVAEQSHRQDRPERQQIDMLAAIRIREIETVIRARHGTVVPDARGTDDLPLVLGYIEAMAGSRGLHRGWLDRWVPWFDDTTHLAKLERMAERLASGKRGPRILPADAAAKLLHVTYEERQRMGLTTIGAVDVDKRERKRLAKARKREMERERQRLRRRTLGRKTWEEHVATSATAAEPWKAKGVSRATYYRRLKRARDGDETNVLEARDYVSSINNGSNTVVSQLPPCDEKDSSRSMQRNPSRNGEGVGQGTKFLAGSGAEPQGAFNEGVAAYG